MSYGVDGVLGLRSNIKTFKDLVLDDSWSKRLLVELYPGQEVTDWSLYSGSVYVAPLDVSHDGVRLDVVNVTSTTDAMLTRNRANTTLSAGEYYYDVDEEASDARWDDGVTRYDDGVERWDQFPKLYVRASDSGNPSNDSVVAEFLLSFGSYPENHPFYGEDMITNGDFETWANSVPTGWNYGESEVAGGTATLSEGTTEPLLGDSYVHIAFSNLPYSGGWIYQDVTVIPGQRYRLSYAYRKGGAGAYPLMRLDDHTGGYQACVLSDGRTYSTSVVTVYFTDEPPDVWHRATFDFEARTGMTTLRIYLGGGPMSSSMANGSVDYDDVKLMPIDRIQHYSPRVSGASVPSITTASSDIFFGGKQVGVGSVALLNQDNYFETLGGLDWVNHRCIVKVGGAYHDDEDLELIAVDDYRTAFTGLIQGVNVDDTEFALNIQDVRSTHFKTLPPNTYEETTFNGMAISDIGRVRPLWFGPKSGIRPIRIGYSDDGYGVYELADCTQAPAGITEITTMWSYVDAQAARDRDASRRRSLDYFMGVISWTDSTNCSSTNSNIKKTGATAAWDEGSRSTNTVAAGNEYWYVEATLGKAPSLRVLWGITTDNPDWDYDTIDFALDPDPTNGYRIWENGTLMETTGVIPAQFDRMRIWVQNGEVTFWVNGTLLYTSTTAASGNYYVRTSHYSQYSMLTGVRLHEKTSLYYTENLANGQFTMDRDCKVHEVLAGENQISFQDTTSPIDCSIPPGIYLPEELACAVGAAMAGAANSQVYYGDYADNTHLITLYGNSTTDLLIQSGDNKKLYGTLGFTGSDTANTATNVADTAIFEDPDTEHTIRVRGQGYKDDASGTYTGTANALIEVGADIMRAIALIWLNQPASVIDEASFQLARDRAPESLGAYINKSITTKQIYETLEFSNIANISIGGDGTIFYDVYIGDVPTGTLTVEDRDFSSFGVTWESADVYRTVRVYYNQDPEGIDFPSRYRDNPSAQTRFGKPDSKDIETWITAPDGAQAAADRFNELAQAPARQLRCTVRGKLLDHRIGQKVRVTRSRAAGAGGTLTNAIYRIISLRQNYALGITQVIAVPDVVTVAGIACAQTCQSYCQTACQATCQQSCQQYCEVNCQVGCEVSCQDCVQVSCQSLCESVCQEACQVTCQAACEAACQTSCQTGSCQYACQYTCQTTCQKTCQTGCEVSCQTACQTSCQDTCQINCQTYCELYCQSNCQWECQSYYEYYNYA